MTAPQASNLQVLPCPFCGSPAREAPRWPKHYGCSNEQCGALHASLTAEQWNMRPVTGETTEGVTQADARREARFCENLATTLHALGCKEEGLIAELEKRAGMWDRLAVKTSVTASASTGDNAAPSRSLPSPVECPKCRTELAFEGDVCGLCNPDFDEVRS